MLDIFKHLAWANIFKYSSEIFMANEFHKLHFTCDEDSGQWVILKVTSTSPFYQIIEFLKAFDHVHYIPLYKIPSVAIIADVPCLVEKGDNYLHFMYPGALENMSRNFAVMAGFVGGLTLMSLVVYKVWGIYQLHWSQEIDQLSRGVLSKGRKILQDAAEPCNSVKWMTVCIFKMSIETGTHSSPGFIYLEIAECFISVYWFSV